MNIYENMSITDRAEKLEKDPLKVLQIIRESTDISNAPISSAGALGASDDVLEQSKDAILALAVRLDFSGMISTKFVLENELIANFCKDFQKTAQRIFHSTSLLATASHKPEKYNVDFVLLHTLTAAHAVQVILPYLPKKHKTQLVIELWLFVVITYISGQRPVIDEERIWSYEVEKENKSWDFIIRHAFSSEMRFDAHYLKG